MVNDPRLGESEFKFFKNLIYEHAGISLAETKTIMVQGRLAKRLRALQIDSFADYQDVLESQNNLDELTHFINALTTNKTDFFREKHHFEYLSNVVFPAIDLKARSGHPKKLRIWCSASSTGEEPYTLAMAIREYFGPSPDWDIRILASDIDTDVLNTASHGEYQSDRVDDLPASLLKKYFDKSTQGQKTLFTAKETLRELITFRRINLLTNKWPIHTEFDVIFCRNVMIYFDQASQKQLIQHFVEHLKSDGYLFIGHSESLFGLSDRFISCGPTTYQLAASPSNEFKTKDSPSVGATTVPKGVRSASPKAKRNLPVSVSTTSHSSGQQRDNARRHAIIVGEVHASQEPTWITTLLGSCVATCLYDEQTGIGGMNHFMLPHDRDTANHSARIGIHAMELLINRIMNLGGSRKRLKAKIFGGGKVINPSSNRWDIGRRNVDFAKCFLESERIPLVASHTGAERGMSVHFHTQSAKVLVRMLELGASAQVEKEQFETATKVIQQQSEHEDITLF